MYELPTRIEVGGSEYEIRSDYRAALDICVALVDPELDDREKAVVALDIFYPKLSEISESMYQEAVEKCLWFIGGGVEQERSGPQPRLLDWEQDFRYIAAPVNRVMGQEIRAVEYLHWWTFLSAYMEIGECLFSQIVRIRERKVTGKSLDKSDREWYRKNRNLVDFKTKYNEKDENVLKQWTGK